MPFNNALWKVAFTGIASNTNVAIMVHKLKRDSSEKVTWCQSACQGSVLMSPLQMQPSMVCPEAPLHANRGVEEVYELTKPILVHLCTSRPTCC
ncbi:hypothetical protein TNCV_248171 [Trichonephila clavipes]|nr:hypothetical protein TNCV_248171 [Trichonephila clavipes]